MFIFCQLVLGHMIGDFLLQFDTIYKLKHKGITGIIPHVLIVMACMTILSWPYILMPALWQFLIFLGASHLVQDWIKIRLNLKYKCHSLFYLADQLLHILFISIALHTSLGTLPQPEFYNIVGDYPHTVLFLIIVIASAFNGYFMIINIKKDFFNTAIAYTSFEKLYGMAERALITSTIILGGTAALIVIPASIFSRVLLSRINKKHLPVDTGFSSKEEIIITCLIGTGFGIIFKLLSPH